MLRSPFSLLNFYTKFPLFTLSLTHSSEHDPNSIKTLLLCVSLINFMWSADKQIFCRRLHIGGSGRPLAGRSGLRIDLTQGRSGRDTLHRFAETLPRGTFNNGYSHVVPSFAKCKTSFILILLLPISPYNSLTNGIAQCN